MLGEAVGPSGQNGARASEGPSLRPQEARGVHVLSRPGPAGRSYPPTVVQQTRREVSSSVPTTWPPVEFGAEIGLVQAETVDWNFGGNRTPSIN